MTILGEIYTRDGKFLRYRLLTPKGYLINKTEKQIINGVNKGLITLSNAKIVTRQGSTPYISAIKRKFKPIYIDLPTEVISEEIQAKPEDSIERKPYVKFSDTFIGKSIGLLKDTVTEVLLETTSSRTTRRRNKRNRRNNHQDF